MSFNNFKNWFPVFAVLMALFSNNAMAFSNPSANPTGGAGSIYIEASTPANTFYLKSNGNVGIGTTNPGAKLEVNGTAYVPRIFINRSSAAGRGISWYSPSYTSWTDYMCQAGQTSCGPNANLTTPTGTLVTSWGQRSFIENSAGYGWTFESGTSAGQPAVVAEIRSSDGSAKFNGTVTAAAFAGPLSGSISSANVSSGSFGANTGGGNYSFPANLGVGTASPAGRLHVMALTSAYPATSGTVQTGLIQRFQNADSNLVADFGANGGNGVWIQSTNSTDLASTYPILLNPNGGNIGIGVVTPGQRLEVNGNVKIGDNIMVEGNSSYITYRNLASYSSNVSGSTGAFVIETNQPWNGPCMFRMRVVGYFYDSTAPFDISIGGYMYNTNIFVNYGYTNVGSKKLTVRGARNISTGKIAIIIGNEAATYEYPKMSVVEFSQGYNSINESYADGWSIVRQTSLANYDYLTTFPDTTSVGGSLTSAANVSSGNFGANTGGGNYSFPANVGIGTTTPGTKLEVQGAAGGPMASTALFGGNGGNAAITINSAGTSNYAYQTFAQGGTGKWEMGATGDGNGNFYLNPTVQNGFGGAAFSILRNSNVGISNTAPAYKLDVSGDIHATGWVRTDGAYGWYSQTYGGGWFMQDSSWIRTYGAKNIWTSSGLIGGDGGLTVGYGGVTPPSAGGIIAGNVGIGTSAPATKLDVDGNITQSVTHGNNMKLWLSAARNGGGTGEVGLYSWISEPGMTWTGGGIARNMYNTTSWPRVNAALSGQMVHFTEGGNIDFTVETAAGSRTTPLTVSPGTATVTGTLTVTGNSNTCHLVSYSGGTTACPAGYYTWSGTALASGYMLCCKVDNPI